MRVSSLAQRQDHVHKCYSDGLHPPPMNELVWPMRGTTGRIARLATALRIEATHFTGAEARAANAPREAMIVACILPGLLQVFWVNRMPKGNH